MKDKTQTIPPHAAWYVSGDLLGQVIARIEQTPISPLWQDLNHLFRDLPQEEAYRRRIDFLRQELATLYRYVLYAVYIDDNAELVFRQARLTDFNINPQHGFCVPAGSGYVPITELIMHFDVQFIPPEESVLEALGCSPGQCHTVVRRAFQAHNIILQTFANLQGKAAIDDRLESRTVTVPLELSPRMVAYLRRYMQNEPLLQAAAPWFSATIPFRALVRMFYAYRLNTSSVYPSAETRRAVAGGILQLAGKYGAKRILRALESGYQPVDSVFDLIPRRRREETTYYEF
jgi:hypothetical protein